MRLWFAWLGSALMLALLLSRPAQAQWTPPAGQAQVCVMPLSAGQGANAVLARQSAFNCAANQRAHGPGNYWALVKFAPISTMTEDPVELRFTSLWQDHTKIHFRYADGQHADVSYSQAEASRYLTMGAIFVVPVPRRDAALTAILFDIRGSANLRGILNDVRLLSRSDSQGMTRWLIALYSAFAGLSLGLLVYNFAVWVALRHRFQLIYCAMMASVMGYAFTSSGSLMLAFPSVANLDRLRINYVMLALGAMMGALFIRSFLGPKTVGRGINRLISGSIGALGGMALCFAALTPWQIGLLDQIYFLGFFSLLILMIPVMVGAVIQRTPYSLLFVFTWFAPLTACLLRALHGLAIIPYSLLLDNSTLIALAVEALLSSVVITSRLKQLSMERDKAREEEALASRIAATDGLTGLLNRRAFLELGIGRKGFHRLILIDIDHFKKINDLAGHDAGDEVLRRVAQIMQQHRPAGALAVRLGGEEFAMLMPLGQAKTCPPDDLLDTLRTSAMPVGLTVTASIGYSDGLIGNDLDWKHLYRQADSALYRAKHDGRDRVCRATYFPRAAALAA